MSYTCRQSWEDMLAATIDVAHMATKQAREVCSAGDLAHPKLRGQDDVGSPKLGSGDRAEHVAAASPHIERLLDGGRASPHALLSAYRRCEEALHVRTTKAERRDLPEIDERARRSQLRRQHTQRFNRGGGVKRWRRGTSGSRFRHKVGPSTSLGAPLRCASRRLR